MVSFCRQHPLSQHLNPFGQVLVKSDRDGETQMASKVSEQRVLASPDAFTLRLLVIPLGCGVQIHTGFTGRN